MKNLWSDLRNVEKLVSSAKRRLVLLDFDGTLAPIAEMPEAVSLDEGIRHILSSLAGSSKSRLAVISGRPLREVRALVRLRNVIYAGNHGLEMKGSHLSLPPNARRARRFKRFIRLLSQKFKVAFGSYQGVWVEDKNFTLSLHFRKLPPGQHFMFHQLVRFFKQRYSRYPLRWMKGKKVWEIRPNFYEGKGDTVRYLLKKYPGSWPIAVGDDQADEDMFKAVQGCGLSIRVGYLKSSRADYYLASQHEVMRFLRRLLE